MCSAVRRRMLVCGMVVSRSPARATGWGAAAGADGAGAGAAGWAGAAVGAGAVAGASDGAAAGAGACAAAAPPPWSSTASTSLRVMRPPGPVPGIAPGSRSFSLISLRTTGDSSRPLAPGSPSAGGAAAGAEAAAGGGCARAGGARGGTPAPPAGGRLAPGGVFVAGGALAPARRRVADARQHDTDVDGVALLHEDLRQHAAHGRRHFGVDLVGGHLEERLVLCVLLADLLEPLGDRALGDRLTELRHLDVGHRAWSFRGRFQRISGGGDRSCRGSCRRTARRGWGAAG